MRKLSILAACLAVLLPAASHAQSNAYVTNQSFNQVNVFRTSDWLQLGSIPVGQTPTGISIPTTGGFAYVANRGGNSVSRIDLATSTVTATIPVPGNPTQVAVAPDGSKAYVVQPNNCPTPTPTPVPLPTPTPDPLATPAPATPTPSPTPPPPCTVAVIDTATDTVTGSVTVGVDPFAVAFSPSSGFAYVTNRSDDTVSVIDASTDLVVDELPVGDTPEGIAVNSGEIYVANDVANTVSIYREIDLQPLATIPVGGSPLGVGLSPDGLTGLVSNDASGTVSLFSTGTQAVLSTPVVATNPTGIAYTHDSLYAVVANNTGNSISVITIADGSVLSVPMLGSPSDVAITPEPFYVLTKLATPYQVETGTNVTYTLSYSNKGSGVGTNVLLSDPIPDPNLTFVSATGGGAQVGNAVEWNIPTLLVGESGAVDSVLLAGAAIPDGTLIENVATISDPAGHAVTAEASIRVRTPGSLDLSALYKKVPPKATPRDLVRFKTRISLPPTYTGAEQVDIIVATATPQILYTFTIPAGQVQARRGRYKYIGTSTQGAKIRFQLAPEGRDSSEYRLRFQAGKATLPIADSPTIRITVNLGPDVFTTVRTFDQKRAPAGGQRLFYQD